MTRVRGAALPRVVAVLALAASTFRARSAWRSTLSAISSGIYGAILLVVMLLRPHGLVPGRRIVERTATLTWGRSQQTLKFR